MGVLTRLELFRIRGHTPRPVARCLSGIKGSSRSSRRRMRRSASASRRETWAWEIPSSSATSSCVRSRKKRSRRIRRCRASSARAARAISARSSITSSSGSASRAPILVTERDRRLGRPALRRVVGPRRAGDADGGGTVAQMPAKLALDRTADVRGQQLAATRIAPVDRTDDRQRRHLRQVVALDAASRKAPRGAARQRQVLLDQPAPLRVAHDVRCHGGDATPRLEIIERLGSCIFRIGRARAGYMSSWIMRRTSSFGLSLSVCGAVAALAVGPARADDG